MNPTPYHMWEAECEECKKEMMPEMSTITHIDDRMLNKKKLIRIEKFVCPECGAGMEKKYEEEYQYD